MKRIKFLVLALFVVVSFSLLGVLAGCGNDTEREWIYLITMDFTDNHWQQLNKGASDVFASEGLENCKFGWLAPTTNKNTQQQLSLIESAVNNGAKVILLAATDATESKDTVQAAMAKGVEFVYVDSKSDATGYLGLFSTNNYEAAKDGATEFLARLTAAGKTPADGKIGIVCPDTASTTNERLDGFKDTVEDAGWETELAMPAQGPGEYKDRAATVAATLVDTKDCIALYGTNEGCTVGVGLAIGDGRTGILGAGFDGGPDIDEQISLGNIKFTVGQQPYQMGKLGMELAIQAFKDEISSTFVREKFTDTGSFIYLG